MLSKHCDPTSVRMLYINARIISSNFGFWPFIVGYSGKWCWTYGVEITWASCHFTHFEWHVSFGGSIRTLLIIFPSPLCTTSWGLWTGSWLVHACLLPQSSVTFPACCLMIWYSVASSRHPVAFDSPPPSPVSALSQQEGHVVHGAYIPHTY